MDLDVNVGEELKLHGISYEPLSDTEVRCLCPFHADSTPSCDINTEKQVFTCRSCGAKGPFGALLARVLGKPTHEVLGELESKYGKTDEKPVEPEVVERWHKALGDQDLVNELHKRAVSKSTIRTYRLGFDRGRITIPIQSPNGVYVNVRRYLPGASTRKFTNMANRGGLRLYPVDQLRFDKILLCGGEVKALAALEVLNRYNVGAVCVTDGEGKWKKSFNPYFSGKEIYVCMDIDSAGVEAANKLCGHLRLTASNVKLIELPLDIEKHPKGDLNDFLHEGGNLFEVIQQAAVWSPPVVQTEALAEAKEVSLHAAVGNGFIGSRFNTRVNVAAIDQSTYAIPKKVEVVCRKDQDCCVVCPIPSIQSENPCITLPAESPRLLAMMEAGDSILHDNIKKAGSIPNSCKAVTFEPQSYRNLVDTRVQPELDISNVSIDQKVVPAVFIDCDTEVNGTFQIEGTTLPNPKTQQVTLLVSQAEAVDDLLQSFKLEKDVSCFSPSEWTLEGVQAKLNEIYDDLEANVTRIYQRRDLTTCIDLTFHSSLLCNFDGRVTKATLESLIVGDSGHGKSETVETLRQHYKLGEKVDCKNASRAGLLGGVEQIAGKHFVTWGVIPRHDGRLVVLEELKGMHPEVFASLTDMRSSGIAEIPKIRRGRAMARTRLIANSNTRSNTPMCAYGFGVEALVELIPGLEDIRRFDLAYLVDKEDVDIETVQMLRPTVEHTYTSELCRQLVLWSWTRTKEQIVFDDGIEEYIRLASIGLCKKFTDEIPILDRGSSRFKVMRMAIAIAARTYSHREDCLLVRSCHVDWVVDFLERIYSARSHGYLAYSEHVKAENQLDDKEMVMRQIRSAPNPTGLAKSMLGAQKIEHQDVQDWCNYDIDDARLLVSILVQNNALKRINRYYVKTSPFTSALHELAEDTSLVPPTYLPDDEREFI